MTLTFGELKDGTKFIHKNRKYRKFRTMYRGGSALNCSLIPNYGNLDLTEDEQYNFFQHLTDDDIFHFMKDEVGVEIFVHLPTYLLN